MEILPSDVLFVWGNGWIDEAIEHVTHGPSHCAIFLDNQTLAEAQGGRKTGAALLSNYLNGNTHLEVWRDDSLTDDERERIVIFAKSHFGLDYDYFAILAELVRFEAHMQINSFHEGKRRICSSFVNDCSKAVGRNWANISYPPAPVDLILSRKLTRKGAIENGK